jgi:hypothetical protein
MPTDWFDQQERPASDSENGPLYTIRNQSKFGPSPEDFQILTKFGSPAKEHRLFVEAPPICKGFQRVSRHPHTVKRCVLIRITERHSANH